MIDRFEMIVEGGIPSETAEKARQSLERQVAGQKQKDESPASPQETSDQDLRKPMEALETTPEVGNAMLKFRRVGYVVWTSHM